MIWPSHPCSAVTGHAANSAKQTTVQPGKRMRFMTTKRAQLWRRQVAQSTHAWSGLTRLNLERATGIEPAWPAWKAGTLPLSYTRDRPDNTCLAIVVNEVPCGREARGTIGS